MHEKGLRIAVVDDHEVILRGLQASLGKSRIKVVASAVSVAELLARPREADVVLLDLRLGDDSDPKENTEALIAAGYRVLVYSIADNPRLIRRALAGGAEGVVAKAQPITEAAEAIRQVANGQTVLSQEVLAAIEGDSAYVAVSLGGRERQVLGLYAAGLEVHDIAEHLSITENSVKEYLKRIRTKYTQVHRPASNKLDLYKRAVEDGIVPPVAPLA